MDLIPTVNQMIKDVTKQEPKAIMELQRNFIQLVPSWNPQNQKFRKIFPTVYLRVIEWIFFLFSPTVLFICVQILCNRFWFYVSSILRVSSSHVHSKLFHKFIFLLFWDSVMAWIGTRMTKDNLLDKVRNPVESELVCSLTISSFI